MKVIPMLMSGPMVRSLLDGTKTQTRRIVKLKNENLISSLAKIQILKKEGIVEYELSNLGKRIIIKTYCPIQKNDIVWIRETWTENGLGYYRYKADGWKDGKGPFTGASVPDKFRNKWKPSIFMPKAACRIFLKVTNVRLERLDEISEADAIAEGIELNKSMTKKIGEPIWNDYTANSDKFFYQNPINSFGSLWDSINGQDSTKSNPWVWVYDLEEIKMPNGFLL